MPTPVESFQEKARANLQARGLTHIYSGFSRFSEFETKYNLPIAPTLAEVNANPLRLKIWLCKILRIALVSQFHEDFQLEPQLESLLNPSLERWLKANRKRYSSSRVAQHLCIAWIREFTSIEEPIKALIFQVLDQWGETKYRHKATTLEDELNFFKNEKTPATLPPELNTLFAAQLQSLQLTPIGRFKFWLDSGDNKRFFRRAILIGLLFTAGLIITCIAPGGQLLGMSLLWWSTGATALSMQLGVALYASRYSPNKMRSLFKGSLLCILGLAIMLLSLVPPSAPLQLLVGLIFFALGSAFANAATRTANHTTYGIKWVIPGIISFVITLTLYLIPPLGITFTISQFLGLATPTFATLTHLIADAITVISINFVSAIVNLLTALVAKLTIPKESFSPPVQFHVPPALSYTHTASIAPVAPVPLAKNAGYPEDHVDSLITELMQPLPNEQKVRMHIVSLIASIDLVYVPFPSSKTRLGDTLTQLKQNSVLVEKCNQILTKRSQSYHANDIEAFARFRLALNSTMLDEGSPRQTPRTPILSL